MFMKRICMINNVKRKVDDVPIINFSRINALINKPTANRLLIHYERGKNRGH